MSRETYSSLRVCVTDILFFLVRTVGVTVLWYTRYCSGALWHKEVESFFYMKGCNALVFKNKSFTISRLLRFCMMFLCFFVHR